MTRRAMQAALGVATAAGLAWAGAAFAQAGAGGGGTVGGPSAGGSASNPDRSHTPITGGGATTQTGKSSRDTSSQAGEVAGTVRKFDREKNMLSFKDAEQKVKVSPSTQVTKEGGGTASLDDIKEGDQVRASYSGTGDDLSATRIEILGAGAKVGSSGASSRGPPSVGGPTPAPSSSGSSSSKSSGTGSSSSSDEASSSSSSKSK